MRRMENTTLSPPHQTEAPVLDLMYDLCGNKQYGYQKACTYMSNMGILARSGKPFTPSTLKGIISNPANIGKVRWGHRKTVRAVKDGRVVKSRPKATDYILSDAAWAPRISPDLFKRANQPKGCFSAPVRRTTDRYKIYLQVWSDAHNAIGLWSVRKRKRKRPMIC